MWFARGLLPLQSASATQSESIFIFSLVFKKKKVTTHRGTLSLRLESHQSLELQSYSSHSNSNSAPICNFVLLYMAVSLIQESDMCVGTVAKSQAL